MSINLLRWSRREWLISADCVVFLYLVAGAGEWVQSVERDVFQGDTPLVALVQLVPRLVPRLLTTLSSPEGLQQWVGTSVVEEQVFVGSRLFVAFAQIWGLSLAPVVEPRSGTLSVWRRLNLELALQPRPQAFQGSNGVCTKQVVVSTAIPAMRLCLHPRPQNSVVHSVAVAVRGCVVISTPVRSAVVVAGGTTCQGKCPNSEQNKFIHCDVKLQSRAQIANLTELNSASLQIEKKFSLFESTNQTKAQIRKLRD